MEFYTLQFGTIMTLISPGDVACGSGIMIVNSPSGSRPTLQRDPWLWDDMSLNSPGGSTLQCGMWLWDDMPLNSPKRPPYWNSISDFDFDYAHHRSRHVILHQSAKFYPNRVTLGEKNDVLSIFKMADLRHLGF